MTTSAAAEPTYKAVASQKDVLIFMLILNWFRKIRLKGAHRAGDTFQTCFCEAMAGRADLVSKIRIRLGGADRAGEALQMCFRREIAGSVNAGDTSRVHAIQRSG
jgi:hypothetical protein